MRDCLVVGADGLVGEHLVRALRAAGRGVVATSRRGRSDALELDLVRPDVAVFGEARFACAFLCAAVTSMQSCEQAPAEARRVNVDGALAVMRNLAATGTRIVFFSSSQVFDGETAMADEDAPRAPRNVYGRQKAEVEDAVVADGLPVAILRPTKIVADRPVGMFATWYERLRRGEAAVAATNMTLAPVAARDVAQAAIRLADAGCTGAWHLSSADELTYHDAALRMAEICALPQRLIRGEAVGDAQVPSIFRQRHAALGSRKIAAAFGFPIRAARAVLDDVFGALASNAA